VGPGRAAAATAALALPHPHAAVPACPSNTPHTSLCRAPPSCERTPCGQRQGPPIRGSSLPFWLLGLPFCGATRMPLPLLTLRRPRRPWRPTATARLGEGRDGGRLCRTQARPFSPPQHRVQCSACARRAPPPSSLLLHWRKEMNVPLCCHRPTLPRGGPLEHRHGRARRGGAWCAAALPAVLPAVLALAPVARDVPAGGVGCEGGQGSAAS
jgi:hypothetical protein